MLQCVGVFDAILLRSTALCARLCVCVCMCVCVHPVVCVVGGCRTLSACCSVWECLMPFCFGQQLCVRACVCVCVCVCVGVCVCVCVCVCLGGFVLCSRHLS